ncbi:MAG: ATP-grasp domain-containing protein [Chloroflexi bacterium]|nr:ATP-grasp domain-containing protein [Chloroflexota bacterium]
MFKTILVTDVDRGSGLTIVRSLGRKGFRVIAGAVDRRAIGFYSRYTTDTCIYPAAQTDPQGFVETILKCVSQYDVDLIIPVTDEVILPLASVQMQFDGLCKIAMPTPEQLDIVTDKLKTLQLATSQNVPVPHTTMLHSVADARAISDKLHWPVVLKPLRSRLYTSGEGIEVFKVCYAQDKEDLFSQMALFEGRCAVLLQEYHAGDGYGVELLMCEGQPICAFQHKRLHEVPITGGASSLRESVELDPVLYEHSIRMLAALNWTGVAMVEFKVSEDGPRLMEINGRVWGSLPLAVHSGMDFPTHLAELYLSDSFSVPTEPDTQYRVGIRARNLRLDVVWLLSVLRGNRRHAYIKTPARSKLIPAIGGYFNPQYKTDVQSWDDPLPGLLELPRIVTRMVSKL